MLRRLKPSSTIASSSSPLLLFASPPLPFCCCPQEQQQQRTFFTRADYTRSIAEPAIFWGERAENIHWLQKYDSVSPDIEHIKEHGYGALQQPVGGNSMGKKKKKLISKKLLKAGASSPTTPSPPRAYSNANWFRGGKLNVCQNAVDRHVSNGHGNRVALYYDSPVTGLKRQVTYRQLLESVCLLTRVLSGQCGLKKGDVAVIYMPNGVEAITAMLACARLGVTHSVVFGGFAAPELAKRVLHCGAKVILTCSGGVEGSKHVDYIKMVEEAMSITKNHNNNNTDNNNNQQQQKQKHHHEVEHVLFFQRHAHSPRHFPQINNLQNRFFGRGIDWQKAVEKVRVECVTAHNERLYDALSGEHDEATREDILPFPSSIVSSWFTPCVPVESEHDLYLLYSSGTTGQPKGIARPSGGTAVMLNATMKHIYNLDPNNGDVMFAASDLGWVVGHSYIVYGPLLNGLSSVVFEGKPVGTPDASTFFRIIEEYRVNCLFTAPTSIRAIRAVDPMCEFRKQYDLTSLRTLVLAGERSDPSMFHWARKNICPRGTVDEFWQTETGAAVLSPPRSDTQPVPISNTQRKNRPDCFLIHEDERLEDFAKRDVIVGSAGVPCPGWEVKCIPSAAAAATEQQQQQHHHHAEGENAINAPLLGTEGGDKTGELIFKLPLAPGTLTGLWEGAKPAATPTPTPTPAAAAAAAAPSSSNNTATTTASNSTTTTTTTAPAATPAAAATTKKSKATRRPLPPLMHRTYCADHKGYFCSFDAGRIDPGTNYVSVMTRIDDIINVAGHRLSTGQLEEAIGAHNAVAESAVVGRPCDLKGQRPIAFVVLKAGREFTPDVAEDLDVQLRQQVGPIATARIVVTPKLPKTRSGKVLRNLLRQVAAGVERKKLIISPTIEDLKTVDVVMKCLKEQQG